MQARLVLFTLAAFERVEQLRHREEGQSAVEYGVILALILAVSVGVITVLGTQIEAAYQVICKPLNGGAAC